MQNRDFVGSSPTTSTNYALLAQRESNRFLIDGSLVQIQYSAPVLGTASMILKGDDKPKVSFCTA